MDDFELLKQHFNDIINTFNYSKIIKMGISLEICSDYTYNKSDISSILEHNEFNESLQIFNRIIEADTLPITIQEFNNTELNTLINFLKEQYVEDKNSLNIFKKETFFKRLLLAIKLFTSINYTDADYDFKFLVDSKYYRGDDFYTDKYGENFIYPGSPPRFVDNISDLLNQLQGLINKGTLESGQESSHLEDTKYILKLIEEINNINKEFGKLFNELYFNNLNEIKQNIDIDKYFIDIPDEEIDIAYNKGKNALLILYLEKMLFNMLYTKLVELNQNTATNFTDFYIKKEKNELQDIIKEKRNNKKEEKINNKDWTKFIEIKDIDDAYKKGKDRLLHLILTHIIQHEEYLIQLEAKELVKAFNPQIVFGNNLEENEGEEEEEEEEGEEEQKEGEEEQKEGEEEVKEGEEEVKEEVPKEDRLLYEYLLNELNSLNKKAAKEFKDYLFGKSANVLKEFLFIIKNEGKIEWINSMSDDVIHAAYKLKGDKAKYALYFIILNAVILYEQGQKQKQSSNIPSNQKEDKSEFIKVLINELIELDLESAGYFLDKFYYNTTLEQIETELRSIQTNKFDNPLKYIPTEQSLNLQKLQILILNALIQYKTEKKTQPIQGTSELNDKINLLKEQLSKLSRFAYTFYSNDLDISHKETLKKLLLKEIKDDTKKTVFLNVNEDMINTISQRKEIEHLKLLWLETVVNFLNQPKE